MPELNGWTKWLVSTLWGALAMVVLFMGNTVRANDNKAIKENTAIRKEIVIGDNRVLEKVERKMDEFSREQVALKVNSAKILEMVKYLKEKAE